MAYIRQSKAKGEKRWEWSVRLRGYPHRHGTCPTKTCARECASKAERELKAGVGTGMTTVTELLDLYETSYLPKLPKPAHKYRQHLAWWRDELGAYLVQAVTPQLIAAAKARLKSEPTSRGPNRCNSTVNRYVTTLSSVWTWAMSAEVGLADRHVVREVERLTEPPGRVRWLSRPVDVVGNERSELEALLRACAESRSSRLLDAVILLLGTGCRENEIMAERQPDRRRRLLRLALPELAGGVYLWRVSNRHGELEPECASLRDGLAPRAELLAVDHLVCPCGQLVCGSRLRYEQLTPPGVATSR